jgi:hypothetical protein
MWKKVILLVLAVAVVALLLRTSSGQQNILAVPHWPPHPADIIDIHSDNLGPPQTVHPGSSITIFQVPPDQSFVLTGVLGLNNTPFRLSEDLGGNLTFKLASIGTWPVYGLPTDGPLGIVFRPGSSVVAVNASTVDQVLYNTDLYGYVAR